MKPGRGGRRPGAGRPRGTYRWTPERIAKLWWDAQLAAEQLEQEGVLHPDKKMNKTMVIRRLKQQFGYARYYDEEQLRQLLSKAYEGWRSSEDEADEFNACVLARLLGEEENKE